jgi:plastocyanin
MTPIRLAALAALLVAVAACSGGAAASISPPPDADATVDARGNQFVERTVELPAGEASRLFFRNLDPQPHNVAVYTDASATRSLFVGETITNDATVYEVPPLEVGSYFFRCDVHPEMTGTVDVEG